MRALGTIFKPFSLETAMGTSRTALRDNLGPLMAQLSSGVLSEDDEKSDDAVRFDASNTETRRFCTTGSSKIPTSSFLSKLSLVSLLAALTCIMLALFGDDKDRPPRLISIEFF